MPGRRHTYFVILAATLLAAQSVQAAPAASESVPLGKAPGLTAKDLGDQRFDLSAALESGPVVVTFWATWCKPCRKELPELQKLVRAHRKHGFQVVAVSGDGPVDQAKVRPYIKASGFDFVVIPDPDGDIRRRFQVEVFPTTFLIDQEGMVVHRQVGYRQGDEKIIEAALEGLLPEGPPKKKIEELKSDEELGE